MASARQIAANRKNARKSTGPRTRAGKQRACRNAYRHGLSIQTDDGESCDAVESLVQRMALGSTDQDLLHWAAVAARAHLELARIRHVKWDIVGRMAQFGALEPAALFRARAAEMRYLKSLLNKPMRKLKPIAPLPIPSEAEREAEAVQRLLPELRKLNRYEARAHASWDRALAEISLRMSKCDSRLDRSVPIPTFLQNEANIIENTTT
jgi:hypothetical protein